MLAEMQEIAKGNGQELRENHMTGCYTLEQTDSPSINFTSISKYQLKNMDLETFESVSEKLAEEAEEEYLADWAENL